MGAGVHRYAYNVKTKWASFHDFHFDEALEAQTRVFEKHARRLLRLHGDPDRRLGSKRVIQCRFNVSVPRARVPEKASALRDRSER